MISRSLGPRLGGSIALVYFLGLILLGVLEVLGAVEVFHSSSHLEFEGSSQLYSTISLLVMGAIIMISPKLVGKLSSVFFGIVILTVIMFFVGIFMAPFDTDSEGLTGLNNDNFEENLSSDYKGEDFYSILAIFFPCFACIFAGSHKGPDLKTPTKSIPKGTLSAVVFSWVMYSCFMVLWGGVAHREYLKGNFSYFSRRLAGGSGSGEIVKDLAVGPPVILETGIIVASLSMALQCFIVAYKMIKNVAMDNVLPGLRWIGNNWKGEPVVALMVTLSIAEIVSLAGTVDVIAPILTMCFLIMFVMVNFSCFVMCFLLPPTWKPPGIRKFRWRLCYKVTSICGALMSVVFMFMIEWIWALCVTFAACMLYVYISVKGITWEWGSGMKGLKLQIALSVLHNYQKEKSYTLHWKPKILCYYQHLDNSEYTPEQLLSTLEMIGKDYVFVIVVGILKGDPLESTEPSLLIRLKKDFKEKSEGYDVKAFQKVVVNNSVPSTLSFSFLSTGLGGLAPNTLLLNMPLNPSQDKVLEFCQTVKLTFNLNKALMVVKDLPNFPTYSKQKGCIDIWWIVHDGGLLVYLSYLISLNKHWWACKKRVFIVGEETCDKEQVQSQVKSFFFDHHKMTVDIYIIDMQDEDIYPYTQDWSVRVKNLKQLPLSLNKMHSLPNVITSEHMPKRHSKESAFHEKFTKLNSTIQERSIDSPLVLMTLPEPNFEMTQENCEDYYGYLLTLSEGLQRVVFMLGNGTELISN